MPKLNRKSYYTTTKIKNDYNKKHSSNKLKQIIHNEFPNNEIDINTTNTSTFRIIENNNIEMNDSPNINQNNTLNNFEINEMINIDLDLLNIQQLIFQERENDNYPPYFDCGLMNYICESCGAQHFAKEKTTDNKFKNCCHKGHVILPNNKPYPKFKINHIVINFKLN